MKNNLLNAYEEIHYLIEETRDSLVDKFRNRETLKWPVVPKAVLHRVWLDFSNTGRVNDERALDSILASMKSSLAHLSVATIISEHSGLSKEDFLEEVMTDPEEIEAFVEWVINDNTGHWRISDYGIEPLSKAIARAMSETKCETRLKYIDQALNVVHQRSDLSRLFVEGGRNTVIEIGDTEELFKMVSEMESRRHDAAKKTTC